MRQHKESAQSLSYHIALGGIIAALCIACMFLTGVFPMFYLILPMLASAFIYIMVLETSGYWGFLTYLSVGLLSIFVTPNKDASLAFLFFFGYFPLLRHLMERFRWKFVGFLLRLAVFNAAVLAFFWVRTGHEGAAGIPGRLRQIRRLDTAWHRKRHVLLLRFQHGEFSGSVPPLSQATHFSRRKPGILKGASHVREKRTHRLFRHQAL